ncbi:MAG TPA: hypothetical protein VJA47_01670 [archaeon]|nr:hypothetical protein [archaeon]
MVAILPFKEADLFANFSSRGIVQMSADKISITMDDFPVVVGSDEGIEGVRKGPARVDIEIDGNPRVLVITESVVSANRISLDEDSRRELLEAASTKDVSVLYTTEEPRIKGLSSRDKNFVFGYGGSREQAQKPTTEYGNPNPQAAQSQVTQKRRCASYWDIIKNKSEAQSPTNPDSKNQSTMKDFVPVLEKSASPSQTAPPPKPAVRPKPDGNTITVEEMQSKLCVTSTVVVMYHVRKGDIDSIGEMFDRKQFMEYLNELRSDRAEKQKAREQQEDKEQAKFFVPWQIIIDVLGEDEVVVENLAAILEIPTSESWGVEKSGLERLFTGLHDPKSIGRLRGEYRDTREWALLERIQDDGFNLISQINQAATDAKGWITELQIANALGVDLKQTRALLFYMCPEGYNESYGMRESDFERSVIFEYGNGADNIFKILGYTKEEIYNTHQQHDDAMGTNFYGFRDYTPRQLLLLGLDPRVVERIRTTHGNKIPGYEVTTLLRQKGDYDSLRKLGYVKANNESDASFRLSLPNTIKCEKLIYNDLKAKLAENTEGGVFT